VKRLVLLLAILTAAIQWPLWFGPGGWIRVAALERELDGRLTANEALRERNRALGFEISSLEEGTEATEERARSELHMARPDETFFQWLPAQPAQQSPVAPIAIASRP
jgi:cell division protein FtsB